jgi:hypothetical protein
MATQTRAETEQEQTIETKIQQLRDLFADAPEVGKKGTGECARSTDV